MKHIILLPLILSLLMFSCSDNQEIELSRQDYIHWAERMAQSQIAHNPELWQSDYQKKPKWDYTQGIIANAILNLYYQTEDSSLLNYVQQYADYFIQPDGNILTYKQKDYNIDRVMGGYFLFELNQINPKIEYQYAIDLLREQLKTQPRTTEGGFWHKKIYPNQMWLDGLYMGEVFYARYAIQTQQLELFEDIARQFIVVDKHTKDEKTGLNFHGWDESREQQWADSITGCSPNFWSRSIGWYVMALVDVLDLMPIEQRERNELLTILNRVCAALMEFRDEETGMWWQVTNFPKRDGNYLESTSSAMFCYAFAKGAKRGFLPEEYMTYAYQTFNGMIKHVVKENEDGTVSLTQCCAVAGLGGTPYRSGTYDYYVGETIRDDDPKGVGPFIMAALCLADCKADLVVAQDGSGDFRTIQEAINAVPDYRKKRTIIRIKAGTYVEKVVIPASKQLLSLVGDNAHTTIITYGNYAKLVSQYFPNETLGTSGSATFYAEADDLYVENLTICNSAGEGEEIGQAVAAHISGDRVVFNRCRFLGNQDTLYTFQENSRQLYKNCYIEGTTDFIFGWSNAFFIGCEIHSKKDSYITAASTPQGQRAGYTFQACRLTADSAVTQVYLGRPWRLYAQTVYIDCFMDKHIRPEGWHNWNKKQAEHTTFYAEYGNYGEGSKTDNRADWIHLLSDEQSLAYTPHLLLSGEDMWNPMQIRIYNRKK